MSTPDFNNTLNTIDKFVKEVLNGRNSFEEQKLSEKIHQLNQLCNVSKKRKAESILSKTDVTGNVPNEIWMKIIGYLKTKDVFLGFGQVCKRFNDLTHDPTAIKSFELLNEVSIWSTDTEEVLKILRRSKSLKRIVLKSPNDLLCEEAVFSNPQLKSVMLTSVIKEDSFSKIVESLTKAKGIKHLEILNGNYDYEPFDTKLLMKIADIKNLKTLRLNLEKGIDADFIQKISVSCSNLETIELSNYEWKDPGMQIAFDKLFKERKETLKSFIVLHWLTGDNVNCNILRNLSLCQNLEELSVDHQHCVTQQLSKIAEMCKIKRLMFTCGNKRIEHLFESFNEARFPLLERLCIEDSHYPHENIEQGGIFSDTSLKSLLEKSPSLKSIHLLCKYSENEHVIWNISNELLFQIIKESNVYINFGKIKIAYDYKDGLVLSAKKKNQKRQLSLEQYLLDHDMAVFNKYQKMKVEFSLWFKERSNWHSFESMKELYKED